MVDPSTPRSSAQKASKISTQTIPHTKIGVFASPRPYNPLRSLQTPYLPTPSPSPLSSAMSTINIANSNSCNGLVVDSLDALTNRMRDFSFFSQSTLCMTPPHTPFSLKEDNPSPPPPYDVGPTTTLDNRDVITKFLGDLGLDTEDLSYPITGSKYTSGRALYEAFKQTRSRVIRIFNLPLNSSTTAIALARLFFANGIPSDPPSCSSSDALVPVRMWTLREDRGGRRPGEEESIWAVFRTHEQACSALSICQVTGSPLSVATALETDLEPFDKLRKFEIRAPVVLSQVATPPQFPMTPASPASVDAAQAVSSGTFDAYQISSNPPNPNKPIFRYGDWICASANCAAHNFGRNTNCIGCGSTRSIPSSPSVTSPIATYSNRVASPRFSGYPNSPISPGYSMTPPNPKYNTPINLNQLSSQFPIPQQSAASKVPPSTHSLLTPSGRALAVGGKVQNVSSDPLAPCIIYWPDNEPLPEQGQIRPSGIVNVHQPPILNTGNRGPIEHQPGDWICLKCDYLNWRRRKVCQTCYPYAEGNGDSVSAAVQAERIALLTSVLAQTQSRLSAEVLAQHAQALASVPSRYSTSHNSAVSPSTPNTYSRAPQGPIQRPQPNSTLNSQQWPNSIHTSRSNSSAPDFISSNIVYQTPSSPALNAPTHQYPDDLVTNGAPLLPSFLQNEIRSTIQHSPSSLSPSSTSSADLSFEDGDDDFARSFNRSLNFYGQRSGENGSLSSGSSSSLTMGISSIWALDKNENKPWNTVALPNQDNLVGSRSRTSSRELFKPSAIGI